MPLRIVGDHPLARDEHGVLKSRIATLFLQPPALVTLPGIHATQRLAYLARLNEERQTAGLPPLTAMEENATVEHSVDLIMEDGAVLIRPDPCRLDLAFQADDILQELVSKQRVRFLHVLDAGVRQAIRERGEYWRISSLPQTVDEIINMIRQSRIRIAHLPLYYYNMITGTRYLTCHDFGGLAALDPPALAAQLDEIRQFSARKNVRGYPEVDFFMAHSSFGARDFEPCRFADSAPADLAAAHQALLEKFRAAVPPEAREDDFHNANWRRLMHSALLGRKNETVSEEILQGLSPEFFLQIRWLPGGRIEQGELLFDPIFDEFDRRPDDPELQALCDGNAKSFFFNYIREFGDVEYMNIGRVVNSLSERPAAGADGRRGVYIAEIKQRDADKPVVRIMRILKWGIREHLDENKDLLQSIMEAEEYEEYILDRRLGCRQLGMNLPSRIVRNRIGEPYHGRRAEFEGRVLWATYMQRDYVPGIATDKIPLARFQNGVFAARFAALLGRTAAPSAIVGRAHRDGRAIFDDGDEVLVLDSADMPLDMVVSDHTGAFVDYTSELSTFAADYAAPVSRRLPHVPEPDAFANAYLEAFLGRFVFVQQEYRKRRPAFQNLFKQRQRDVGSFAYRWERVLERLDRTEGHALAAAIRRHIHAGSTGAASA